MLPDVLKWFIEKISSSKVFAYKCFENVGQKITSFKDGPKNKKKCAKIMPIVQKNARDYAKNMQDWESVK